MQFLDKQDVDSLPVAMELCVAMKLPVLVMLTSTEVSPITHCRISLKKKNKTKQNIPVRYR